MIFSRIHLFAILAVASFFLIIKLHLSGEFITWQWAANTAFVFYPTYLVIKVFDRRIWRWNLWQGWLVHRPYIQDTWKVSAESNWIDPEANQETTLVDGEMTITQTFSQLHIRTKTKESEGILIASNIDKHPDGTYYIIGTYLNEPKFKTKERTGSHTHYGTMKLKVEGEPNYPTKMTGHYWTDRGTGGEMEVTRK